MGQRAEMAEAIQLLKQVNEKRSLIPGILLRPPLLVLQELAQMPVGWEVGDDELGSETRVPNLIDGKPSKQKGEDHRE